MTYRGSLLAVAPVIVGALLAAASAGTAATVPGISHITVNRPVALPGVVLRPGAYTFQVLPGTVDIVQVATSDRSRVMFTGFTNLTARPAALGNDTVLTLGEVSGTEPAPITAWFPEGRSMGHQFRYR